MANKDISPQHAVRDYPMVSLTVAVGDLVNSTAVKGKPGILTGTAGAQQCGTIVARDTLVATLNIARGAQYYHKVNNRLTYNAGDPATYGEMNPGTAVYVDVSSNMPAGVYLSLSPLDEAGAANTLFGHVGRADTEIPTPFNDVDAVFPKGTDAEEATVDDVCVVQA